MTLPTEIKHFTDLSLLDPVQRAVQALGYETPTPIQQQTIPALMDGSDVLGHAPTGTGKTAAFALPILSRTDVNANNVQALVVTPTRELAIQVAEAFTRYAKYMKRLRVLPVYGGQDYHTQIRPLSRGVDIVVGTPGRIMDHMRRGTLVLSNLQTLVLDEADEMLRMGFIDDVEWILDKTPETRQTALFSATMPRDITRISKKYLRNPVEISIEGRITTAAAIRQRFWLVSGLHKLDALTRILEAETFDAMLVFVRTRLATNELAEKLNARGFIAAALNGDMPQKQRELTVEKLKREQLDILVATDVVARGLDVARISHVINYDIPYDTEAYVHRIGRTGRAGRTGDAILFVTQRERRLLGAIEKATRQKIEKLTLPTLEMVNNKRIADFNQRIHDTLATGELAYLQRLVEEFSRNHNVPVERIGAALAKMCIGDTSLLINPKGEQRKAGKQQPGADKREDKALKSKAGRSTTQQSPDRSSEKKAARPPTNVTAESFIGKAEPKPQRRQPAQQASIEMERFRVEVGTEHGVKPENLVGAIANEAGLDAEFIGRITIHDQHSLVELPAGMPKFILKDLKRTWVCNHRLNMTRMSDSAKRKGDTQDNPIKEGDKSSAKKSKHKQKPETEAEDSSKNADSTAPAQPRQKERKNKRRHRDQKNKGKRG